jgi:hypothetical protein
LASRGFAAWNPVYGVPSSSVPPFEPLSSSKLFGQNSAVRAASSSTTKAKMAGGSCVYKGLSNLYIPFIPTHHFHNIVLFESSKKKKKEVHLNQLG